MCRPGPSNHLFLCSHVWLWCTARETNHLFTACSPMNTQLADSAGPTRMLSGVHGHSPHAAFSTVFRLLPTSPASVFFLKLGMRRLLFLSGVSSRPPSFLSSSLSSPQHAPSSGLLLTGQGSTMFHFFLSSLHQCSDYPSG